MVCFFFNDFCQAYRRCVDLCQRGWNFLDSGSDSADCLALNRSSTEARSYQVIEPPSDTPSFTQPTFFTLGLALTLYILPTQTDTGTDPN